ncbi:hypothetical protein Skr01_71130 [Sphaerisporangium krabiense]|uniref:Uncharacterized protein n=1 Tax=Sphaerisporangium krabiense TaxID=763782 RepID=A0A7W8Z8I5_9ACTN|nr:hypothetical protein [Sphaerisporangium krabiense]MBB5629255.1 hypothetical protein [Sphaerisporangium krabiense]GII67028.1 hypothetical protein Skr01_71130 [Sphaerisporangium krabiense]
MSLVHGSGHNAAVWTEVASRLVDHCRLVAVREVTLRAFLRRADGLWERRPAIEEIATVSAPAPDAVIHPSVDVYARIRCPVTFVLPDRGFYAERLGCSRFPGRPEEVLNEELVARLMAGFGMRFVCLTRRTGIPAFIAGMATSCSPEEGRRDRVVGLDDPQRVGKFNADWYELSTEYGLFSADRRFLVSLTPAIDPAFNSAREEADDWEDPAWWEHSWGLVELSDEWDLAGAGAASGVLGSEYGHPGFAMSAIDGSVLIAGTVWQDSIGSAVLPKPYRSPTLRELARRNVGFRTPSENEDLITFLNRNE